MTEDLVKKELIGSYVKIVDSRNKSNIGIKGKITDETKNCLIISDDNKEKKVLKENVVIEFVKEGVKIEGKSLLGRPEERIKKKPR